MYFTVELEKNKDIFFRYRTCMSIIMSKKNIGERFHAR